MEDLDIRRRRVIDGRRRRVMYNRWKSGGIRKSIIVTKGRVEVSKVKLLISKERDRINRRLMLSVRWLM